MPPPESLRAFTPRGTTPVAGQSPLHGVRWPGLLRGLLNVEGFGDSDIAGFFAGPNATFSLWQWGSSHTGGTTPMAGQSPFHGVCDTDLLND